MPSGNRITLQIEGTAEEYGHVTLSAFLSQLEAVKSALKHTERLVTGEDEPSVYYRVVDLRHSTPAVVVLEAASFSARPQRDKKKSRVLPQQDYSQATVTHFFRSLRQIREKRQAPDKADLQALEAYRNLTASLQKDVSSVKLINAEQSVAIDKSFQAAVDEIIGPDEFVRGTVYGSLERINLHNTTRFDIFPSLGPRQVACEFKPELRDEVIQAIDKYVSVTGKLRYKRLEDFPYAINAESIEVMPPEAELPTLFDIRGMAPDLTAGRGAAEFLQMVRHGEGW